MRFRPLIAAGTLLVLAAASAPVSAQTFNSTKGYSITPAAGWRAAKPGFMGADIFFFTTPVKKFAPNLNVVVSPIDPGDTLERGMQQIKGMYSHVFKNYHSIQITRSMVGGVPAILSIGTYLSGDKYLRMREAIVIRGSQGYTFTCTAPEAVHAKYDADFTKMIASVHWQ